jgi:hypothetical protein
LLLLPVVQGASRTQTIAALDAMAEVFSDDLKLKIGDLLSHSLYLATRPPCARPFMLPRPIQAHTCMFKSAPVHSCAPATRAHPLLLAICPHALSRVFQEPKTLPEYKHFEPSDPFEPFTGKKHILEHRHLEAGLFIALPDDHLEAGLSCLCLYEDEHDALPPMNHKHEDYNYDYTHSGGTSTKTTTATTHPRRRTPAISHDLEPSFITNGHDVTERERDEETKTRET